MKKLSSVLIVITLIVSLLLASCSGNKTDTPSDGANTLDVSSQELCDSILMASGLNDGIFSDAVTADSTADVAGIPADDFAQYVKDAYMATAQINVNAHLVTVIRLNEGTDTDSVKETIKTNFNSMRWVCVLPQQSFVISSGEYIMLAATYNENVQPLIDAFRTATGDSSAEAEVFFTSGE